MDLGKQLQESGYYRRKTELEQAIQVGAMLLEARKTATRERRTEMDRDIAEFGRRIPECKKLLDKEYEAAVKYVDAENVAELNDQQILEIGELVAEEFDNIDAKAAEWIRALMRGDEPGPPPKPPGSDKSKNSN